MIFCKKQQAKILWVHYTVEEFVQSLEVPRKILIMVKAGAGTDATIDPLVPLLDKGDIMIDGGNAYFPDTQRRSKELEAQGIPFRRYRRFRR